MSNQITATGLQTNTREELLATYTAGMKAIYGSDINLDSDTPDGQKMNLDVQLVLDLLDLVRQVYNSMNPDEAMGTTLDRRVGYNGVQRKGGSFSTVLITIVSDRALSLDGINDTSLEDAYTISDDAGTEYALLDVENFATAGTQQAIFRAVLSGAQQSSLNTITNPVTVVLGVDSVNNPSPLTFLGVVQESDNSLKIRRQISVSRSSQGYLPAMRAELEAIENIGDIKTYENVTSVVDANGIPAHAVWCIVSGTGTAQDIATAIYKKRSGGCNMKGDVTYNYTEVDGKVFVVKWDEVVLEDLYIEFTLSSLDGVNAPLSAEIQAQLQSLYIPQISEKVNINDLVEFIKEIDDNSLVTLEGFSRSGGGPFTNTLSPLELKNQFIIDSTRIAITVV